MALFEKLLAATASLKISHFPNNLVLTEIMRIYNAENQLDAMNLVYLDSHQLATRYLLIRI